jgi:ferredoxin
MAELEQRWPDNVPGPFFVDDHCIDCDLCRTTAPRSFRRSSGGYSFVGAQPKTPAELAEVRQALAECPVNAIGEVGAPTPLEPSRGG